MTKQIIADNLAAYIARNTPSWGNMEYPLFTQDAANACPSARYVGGVSNWLCECRNPKECGGVLAAAQLSTPADPENESIGMAVARLGVLTIELDGVKYWKYRDGILSPRPDGWTIADNITGYLFTRFGIQPGKPLHCGRWHVRVIVQVETGGSHKWETEINGSPESIKRYFIGQQINIGVVDDLICIPRRVEFIKAL